MTMREPTATVRSARRRSDAVGIAGRRTLVTRDERPPRGPQRLADVERAAVAPPTLLGRCGCGMASFGAAPVEKDLGVPADFVDALHDVLERHELRGDDDEIERIQLNHPAWIIARRSSAQRASSRLTIGQSLPHGMASASRMKR